MAIFNPDRQSFGMLISLVKAWQKCHWRGQLEGVFKITLNINLSTYVYESPYAKFINMGNHVQNS